MLQKRDRGSCSLHSRGEPRVLNQQEDDAALLGGEAGQICQTGLGAVGAAKAAIAASTLILAAHAGAASPPSHPDTRTTDDVCPRFRGHTHLPWYRPITTNTSWRAEHSATTPIVKAECVKLTESSYAP